MCVEIKKLLQTDENFERVAKQIENNIMSKRNANRPGYKNTKVGWLPEDWEVKSLGSFGLFSKGKGISNSDKKETGIPCITYGEIYTKHDFNIKEFHSFIDTETTKTSQRIKKNDLLFAGSGETLDEIGKCVAYTKNVEAYAGGDIVIFSPNLVDGIFLSYSLNSDLITRHRRRLGQGHSVVHIYSSGLKTLHVPFPPLPEQEKIAEILSKWDEAIEQTRKFIDSKKCRKKALMQQLLTGKNRLPGFNESWKECRLGELFDERREANNEQLQLLAITGSRGVIPASEVERKDSSSADKSKYKRIAHGDIGYNTMRMWQGVSAVSGLEGIVSPAYTVCIPKETVDVRFMGYFFKFSPVVNLFRRFSQGLVNDTLNLKFHNFAQIKIKIPCLDEQRSIAKILQATDDEIAQLETKLKAIERQKRGLMQKLLTGEVRVIL